ncbi:MAG: hypothetical protein J7J61_07125 [Candidatus Hydrothermae bacterium]|nr:hypothetical protein [Candidatus Hydrothermae bacterium]
MKIKSYTVVEATTLQGIAESLNNDFKDCDINVLLVTEIQSAVPVDTYSEEYGLRREREYVKKYVALVEIITEAEE